MRNFRNLTEKRCLRIFKIRALLKIPQSPSYSPSIKTQCDVRRDSFGEIDTGKTSDKSVHSSYYSTDSIQVQIHQPRSSQPRVPMPLGNGTYPEHRQHFYELARTQSVPFLSARPHRINRSAESIPLPPYFPPSDIASRPKRLSTPPINPTPNKKLQITPSTLLIVAPRRPRVRRALPRPMTRSYRRRLTSMAYNPDCEMESISMESVSEQ